MSVEANLDRVLRGIQALPTLPYIYQSVVQIANDPQSSTVKMAHVIQGISLSRRSSSVS